MTKKEKEQNKFINWFDTAVVADIIFEELEENEVEPTAQNATRVWLKCLEEFHQFINKKI